MAKKVVGDVMIIQKNDSGWGDPLPPPFLARRLRRAMASNRFIVYC